MAAQEILSPRTELELALLGGVSGAGEKYRRGLNKPLLLQISNCMAFLATPLWLKKDKNKNFLLMKEKCQT